MKNISRRVFIKGMAVAAAATAASTVLAGCNFVPGTTEEPEVVPSTKTVTLTDQGAGKSVNLIVNGVALYKESNKAVVNMKVENNLLNSLTMTSAADFSGKLTTAGEYGILVTYKAIDTDGVEYPAGTVTTDPSLLNTDNLFTTGGVILAKQYDTDGVLVVNTPAIAKRDWAKITVTFDLCKRVTAGQSYVKVDSAEYVIEA